MLCMVYRKETHNDNSGSETLWQHWCGWRVAYTGICTNILVCVKNFHVVVRG